MARIERREDKTEEKKVIGGKRGEDRRNGSETEIEREKRQLLMGREDL